MQVWRGEVSAAHIVLEAVKALGSGEQTAVTPPIGHEPMEVVDRAGADLGEHIA